MNDKTLRLKKTMFAFPAEDIIVYTSDGKHAVLECKELDVPVGNDGQPIINRLQIDAHGNLRVTVSENDTQLFAQTFWLWVKVDSRDKIVRDALAKHRQEMS